LALERVAFVEFFAKHVLAIVTPRKRAIDIHEQDSSGSQSLFICNPCAFGEDLDGSDNLLNTAFWVLGFGLW
jgi:hypothetical protein